MVPGSLRIPTVAVFALMLIPLSGCVDSGPTGEEAETDPVVPEEEDDIETVTGNGEDTATATPIVEPTPTTPTEDEATSVTRVPLPETTTPATDVTPGPMVTPTPSPTQATTTAPTDPPAATTETTPATTTSPTSTPTPATTSPPATTTATPTATEDAVTAESDDDEWPREGSFVRYRTTGGASSPGGGFSTSHEADWHIVYQGGTWNGTCAWSRSERVRQYDAESDTSQDEWTNTSGTETVSVTPPEGPTDVAVGDIVAVPHLVGCQEGVFDELTVEEQTTHSAPRQTDGSPTWYGYWNPEWPADAYAYWETESGLVLAWRDQRTNGYDDGWMVDTDAPLE